MGDAANNGGYPDLLKKTVPEIEEVDERRSSEGEEDLEELENFGDAEELPSDARWINTVANPLNEMTIFLFLGLKSYGGVDRHISLFNLELIEKREWIGKQKFSDLCTLALALPGPTSVQLATALGTFRAGFWGGILALIYFSLPGFSLTLLFGLIFNIACKGDPNALLPDLLTPTGPFVQPNKFASFLSEAVVGFPPTALSLIILSSLSFLSKLNMLGMNGKICFISSLITILVSANSATWIFPIVFLCGSLISVLNHWMNDNEVPHNPPSRNQSQSILGQGGSQTNLSSPGSFPKSEKISGFLILIWIISLLLSFTLGRFVLRQHLLLLFCKFYVIGSFSFGNEFVILSFIYKEVLIYDIYRDHSLQNASIKWYIFSVISYSRLLLIRDTQNSHAIHCVMPT